MQGIVIPGQDSVLNTTVNTCRSSVGSAERKCRAISFHIPADQRQGRRDREGSMRGLNARIRLRREGSCHMGALRVEMSPCLAECKLVCTSDELLLSISQLHPVSWFDLRFCHRVKQPCAVLPILCLRSPSISPVTRALLEAHLSQQLSIMKPRSMRKPPRIRSVCSNYAVCWLHVSIATSHPGTAAREQSSGIAQIQETITVLRA